MSYIIYYYSFIFYFILIIHHSISINQFTLNNITVCLFLPTAFDDFPFVQGIISSVDTFWPSGIGKKIHWIDNYYGKNIFKYKNDWKVIKSSTPNISLPIMKQQYNSYISYTYCNSNKYIAMIDSDSVFFTYVKYNMLFDRNRKPYFLYSLKIRNNKWDPRKILKTNNSNWGDVMFTYPIIFKTNHLKELHRYIEKIHNSTLVNLLNEYIFGQFGTFLEYIHIKKYENEYSLINVEAEPFPPRCSIHIPYCFVEVNWGKIQRIRVVKHKNIKQMNKLIYYLIEQGKCEKDRKKCKEFYSKKFEINSYTIESKFKHYYQNTNTSIFNYY